MIEPAVKKYGRLTIQGHRCHLRATGESLRVYLNGVEVKHVIEADDVEGWIIESCRGGEQHRAGVQAGHRHIGGFPGEGSPCKRWLTGNVLITADPQPQDPPVSRWSNEIP